MTTATSITKSFRGFHYQNDWERAVDSELVRRLDCGCEPTGTITVRKYDDNEHMA